MRRSTISGYQGPAEILTHDDVVVAEAACRYRAEEDAAGEDRWHGRLHRISPSGSVTAGEYRLRLDTGRQGDIVITTVTPGSQVVHFDGVGDRPL